MTTSTDQPEGEQAPAEQPPHPDAPRDTDTVRGPLVPGRETVESIVVALFLALLLRAFEAEAFVIPTGSMAPTLMGRHKDLDCSECGFNFQAGASREEDDQSHTLRTELARLDREVERLRRLADDSSAGPQQREVARQQLAAIEAEDGKLALLRLRLAGKMIAAATCPNCGNTMQLTEGKGTDIRYDARYPSFDGDRILVDKFAYDFANPQRWDVVVFKYPEDSDTNYIKRLVGLPGETVQIVGGDIWTSRNGGSSQIARKPPRVMRAMLQTVHDSDHPAAVLQDEGWPPVWTDWAAAGGRAGRWQAEDRRRRFTASCATGESAMLRFRHFPPQPEDWKQARLGQALDLPARPEPVDDFQAYNAIHHQGHWVGDLAVACRLESSSATGVVELDLVDGGQRHRCSIDLASGIAVLTAAGGATGRTQTVVHGQGSWRLLFTNVDDQLRLFVNDKPVVFEQPIVWETPLAEAAVRQPLLAAVVPGDDDPSDLAPAGIMVTASQQPAAVSVSALQVLRDGYYIGAVGVGRRGEIREKSVLAFPLEADQFFVLGDNSAASKDGRLWSDVYHVDRRLLIGRAVAIFWPHMVPAAWHVTVRLPVLGEVRLPSWPNFARMRPIR
jgi:signal peptidase I